MFGPWPNIVLQGGGTKNKCTNFLSRDDNFLHASLLPISSQPAAEFPAGREMAEVWLAEMEAGRIFIFQT